MFTSLAISLSMRLVARLDEEVRGGCRPSRSAALVAALDLHHARRVEDRMRDATVEHYAALSADERREGLAIARASTRALSRVLRRQGIRGHRIDRPR
jgi:Arc/MetJ-type ribon-helix-helix transcriptional regulator